MTRQSSFLDPGITLLFRRQSDLSASPRRRPGQGSESVVLKNADALKKGNKDEAKKLAAAARRTRRSSMRSPT